MRTLKINDQYRRLYIGRILYLVKKDSIKVEETKITAITENKEVHLDSGLNFSIEDDGNNVKNVFINKGNSYHRSQQQYTLFFKKSDAIRLAKSRMFRHLKNLEEKARAAINSLKEFKVEHWDLLQNKYTEAAIIEIEKQYKF